MGLLMAMKMVDTPESELNTWYERSQKVPYKPLVWPTSWDVHLQLRGIRAQSLWPIEEIPWLAELEGHWREILQELEKYNAAKQVGTSAWTTKPQSENLADETGTWNAINILSDSSSWNEENCADHFPITCGLIRSRPHLSIDNFVWPAGLSHKIGKFKIKKPTLFANFYQAMPGSNIRSHFGTHGRVVASLGLKIPTGVKLRVGSQWREWQEGKVQVFDDSFEHEVIHRGTEPRYVFAIAMLHPDVVRQPVSTPA